MFQIDQCSPSILLAKACIWLAMQWFKLFSSLFLVTALGDTPFSLILPRVDSHLHLLPCYRALQQARYPRTTRRWSPIPVSTLRQSPFSKQRCSTGCPFRGWQPTRKALFPPTAESGCPPAHSEALMAANPLKKLWLAPIHFEPVTAAHGLKRHPPTSEPRMRLTYGEAVVATPLRSCGCYHHWKTVVSPHPLQIRGGHAPPAESQLQHNICQAPLPTAKPWLLPTHPQSMASAHLPQSRGYGPPNEMPCLSFSTLQLLHHKEKRNRIKRKTDL